MSVKEEGAAFPHPEKRPLGVFSICWFRRIESCQLLHIQFKVLLYWCPHRLIVLSMQQTVGRKCSIVILDDLIPVGEEIYMRQEQFHRVGIHCKVQFINGRLLRRTDLRREDVIPNMLGKARSGSQIRYLSSFS